MYQEKLQKVKQELSELINTKKEEDHFYDKELDEAINEIIKNNKFKTEEQEYIYFKEIYNFIESKVKKGEYSKEIFASVASIANNRARKVKNGEIKLSDIEKEKTREELLEEINKQQEQFDNYSRMYTEKSARGVLKGTLYKGLFGSTKTEIENYLKKCGVKTGEKDGLFEYMTNEVLEVYLKVLQRVNEMSRINKDDNDFGQKAFRDKYREIIKISNYERIMFDRKNFYFPVESLVNEAFKMYPAIPGVFKERDNVPGTKRR